jgi:hypothetical protein
VPDFKYEIFFRKDTVIVNTEVELKIILQYNFNHHHLKINSIQFPRLHWMKLEGTGVSIVQLDDSIKQICINTRLKFLQTGSYIINSILVYYQFDQMENNLLLNSPEIRIIDSNESWKSYFTPAFIVSSTIFLILIIFLIHMLVRYFFIRKKMDKKVRTDFSSSEEIIENLEKLLLDRRLNYKKNTMHLKSLLENSIQPASIHDEKEKTEIKTLLNTILSKQFITFKEFERIYQRIYSLVTRWQNQNRGGFHAGNSENQ